MFFYLITWQALTTPRSFFTSDHWFALIPVTLFQAIALFILPRALGNSLVQAATSFVARGIKRPSLRGEIFLAWGEIAHAEIHSLRNDMLWLDSPTLSLRIDLGYYRNRKKLLEEIDRRIAVPIEKSKKRSILY